jgi:long-chain acyl-CoA synthetase
MLENLASQGERTAVLSFAGGEHPPDRLSYAALDAHARRLAGGLRQRGLGRRGLAEGAAVGLYAPNSADWICSRLAILFAGCIAVPLDTDLSPSALAQQLDNSAVGAVLTVAAHLDTLEAVAPPECAVWLLDAAPDDPRALIHLEDKPVEALPDARPDDVAALFFTSGTTGPPKGVPLTHRNILGNVAALQALNVVESGDRVLLPLPLHHSYPFIVGMLVPLATGATVVLPSGVSGPEIRHALAEGAVRVVVGVPRLYEALAKGLSDRLGGGGPMMKLMYALLRASGILRRRLGWRVGRTLLWPLHRRLAPRLETLASGGARLDPEVAWTLEAFGWQVLSGYGLVETASIATFNPPGRNRMGSAGLPAPGMMVEIDTTVPVPENGAEAHGGEVLLKGPGVFGGYAGRPEANAAAFTDEGWFRTGDIGHLDAGGYLWITGRAKEMIVLPDGKNIAPEEVEAVYADSPYIAEIAVLERDGALVGLVVPDMDALREASGSVTDLIRIALAEQATLLPAYKRLSDWAMTRETLPRTRLGKYQRHDLPPIYARAQRGEQAAAPAPDAADRRLLADPTVAAVFAWLQARFPDRTITLDTSPQLDLGVDSLAWVALGMELEDRFGLALSDAMVARSLTVRDLLSEIAAAEHHDKGARRRHGTSLPRWLASGQTRPERWGGAALHTLARLLGQGMFRLSVTGADHISATGPLIIAPNHASDLDALMLPAALPGRCRARLAWGADRRRVFGHRLGRLVARLANLFPVDDRAPAASLETAAAALRAGRILIWFPEEFRSPDGRLQTFKPGIGQLVQETHAPVVPCVIAGTYEAMPRGKRVPRLHAVQVTFGPPIPAETLTGETATAADVAARVRRAVSGLMAASQPAGRATTAED